VLLLSVLPERALLRLQLLWYSFDVQQRCKRYEVDEDSLHLTRERQRLLRLERFVRLLPQDSQLFPTLQSHLAS
jgi:hypothetical protein